MPKGKILYLKPPKDLTDFLNYLIEEKYYHIYNYLALNGGSFPCDKTFAVSYHNQLIQAYYLLGKFMGKVLAVNIDNAVTNWPELVPPRYLTVGESLQMTVKARSHWNDSGLDINQNGDESYLFEPKLEDRWSDAEIEADAAGFCAFPLPVPDFMKRVPDARWFELVASVGKDDGFVIRKQPVQLKGKGRLYLFANDADGFYANNSGSIRVTITRTK